MVTLSSFKGKVRALIAVMKKNKVVTAELFAGLIGIIALVLYMLWNVSSVRISADVYRYDTGVRFDYTGGTTLFVRDDDVFMKNGGGELPIDASPIYFAGEERIILPSIMEAALPGQNRIGKTAYYTQVYRKGQDIIADIGKNSVAMNEGFLFDGRDTYVFLDETAVSWGEHELKLAPLSYAIVIYGQRLEVYPFDGEPVLEQTDVLISAACAGGYTINLSEDILLSDSASRLLISHLSLLEELR